jgi:hypothetical protein
MNRLVFTAIVSALAAYAQSTYYVSPSGNDSTGVGSASNPWATPARAIAQVPDNGSTIIVRDGTYGQTLITRKFEKRVLLRAENAYRARIHNANALALFVWNASNVEIAGFDIARTNPLTPHPLATHIAASTNIVFRNNVIHESYNNDLVKINEESRGVAIIGNIFRNQQGGAGQHIDVNGCTDVTIRDNIFFNDAAAGSMSQAAINLTHGFIVVKNSGNVPESRRTRIVNNIFLNYQGSLGSNYVLIGEDAKPFHEAQEIDVENNLMMGNSWTRMRAPFSVKGGRDILFRNNTIVGNFPGQAFAARFLREGANPVMLNIRLLNNIWSDPTGSMEDFSDGPPADTSGLVLSNNLYWNGGSPIPVDEEVLNVTDDIRGLTANPLLPLQPNVVLPNWQGTRFPSGSTTARAEFERLVRSYGTPAAGSPVIGRSDPSETPEADMMDAPRGHAPDIGAVQVNGVRSGLRLALFRPRVMGGDATPLNFVFLNGLAGGTVMLSSSNPAVASVPASVVVPAGDDAVAFAISTTAVSAPVPVTITAISGAMRQTATLTVVPQGVVTFNFLQSTIAVGESTHRIMMEGPASAPVALTLTSSRPDVVSFPAGATVAAGASYADVRIRSTAAVSSANVVLTARYGASEASAVINPGAAASVVLSALSLQPATATGPATVEATVQLSGAAPAGGAVVAITSSATAAATVPATVTVPAGSTSASFNVQALSVTASTPVVITASYSGVQRTATLTVNASAPSATLSGLTLQSATVTGPGTVSATVQLSGAAPAGGAVVTLTSSSLAAARVPANITVVAGSTSASFQVQALSVTAASPAVITASYRGVQRTATLTVNAPAATAALSALTLQSSSITGPGTVGGTVQLSGAAPAGGAVIDITVSIASVVTVPARVTIPAGATSVALQVQGLSVTASRAVVITASYRGVQRTATLTVNAPPVQTNVSLASITAPTSIRGGGTASVTVRLTGPAPAGGTTVSLGSSRPDIISSAASVLVPAGSIQVSVPLTVKAVSSAQLAYIFGVANGVKFTTTTIVP